MMEACRLGQYHPSEWSCPVIDREMRALACIPSCCRTVALEIRQPSPIRPMTADQWHRDFQTPPVEHLVLWATESPTEILTDDGKILRFDPYDVVWINNQGPLHRMPPSADCATRWFTCFRCHYDWRPT
jgi:hypothetical protein